MMKQKRYTVPTLRWRKGQPIPSELAPVETPKIEAPDDDPQPRERRDEPAFAITERGRDVLNEAEALRD